jgi:hypothetical protein
MRDRIQIAPQPRLADALEPSETAAAPARLAYREREVARMLGISLRLWQRAVHAGRAPRADIRLSGRVKLWSRDLLLRWIADADSINGK